MTRIQNDVINCNTVVTHASATVAANTQQGDEVCKSDSGLRLALLWQRHTLGFMWHSVVTRRVESKRTAAGQRTHVSCMRAFCAYRLCEAAALPVNTYCLMPGKHAPKSTQMPARRRQDKWSSQFNSRSLIVTIRLLDIGSRPGGVLTTLWNIDVPVSVLLPATAVSDDDDSLTSDRQ